MVNEKNAIRHRMAKVIKRVANMKVAAAMSGWIAMVTAKKSMRNKMTKVIKRVANMKVAAALTSWKTLVVQAKSARDSAEIEILRAELAKYKAAHEAFEQRLDTLTVLPDFAVGSDRLRRSTSRTPSPRSKTSSPASGRSVLRDRAAARAAR